MKKIRMPGGAAFLKAADKIANNAAVVAARKLEATGKRICDSLQVFETSEAEASAEERRAEAVKAFEARHSEAVADAKARIARFELAVARATARPPAPPPAPLDPDKRKVYAFVIGKLGEAKVAELDQKGELFVQIEQEKNKKGELVKVPWPCFRLDMAQVAVLFGQKRYRKWRELARETRFSGKAGEQSSDNFKQGWARHVAKHKS